MQVVLLQSVKKLGSQGDVLDVGDGYALNFLIPQGKALSVSDAQGKQFLEQVARKKQEQEQALGQEEDLVSSLPSSITLSVPAHEGGGLFRAVTASLIRDHFVGQGIDLPEERFTVPVIKQVGEHTVTVAGKDGERTLTVVVVPAS